MWKSTNHRWLGVVFVLSLSSFLHADQIILTNGDCITGKSLGFDGKVLTLQSDLLGPVKTSWNSVKGLSVEQPAAITLNDGQVVHGALSYVGGKWHIKTADGRFVTISKEAIHFIRSEQQQIEFEAEQNRLGLLNSWNGTVDAGLTATRGNADISTLNLAMKAARTTERDRFSTYIMSLFSRSTASNQQQTIARSIRSELRYDHLFAERLFTFGLTDFDTSKTQNLILRNVIGGGFGYQVKKSSTLSFDLLGGGSFALEHLSTLPVRRSVEGLIGEDLSLKFWNKTQLSEVFVFYPNLTERTEYRIAFDATASTKIVSWLSWQVTLSNRFLSNPIPGTNGNNLILSTGIRLSLGKERAVSFGSPLPTLISK